MGRRRLLHARRLRAQRASCGATGAGSRFCAANERASPGRLRQFLGAAAPTLGRQYWLLRPE
eukprot:12260021-Alexandrium_andersonii.AAC.1